MIRRGRVMLALSVTNDLVDEKRSSAALSLSLVIATYFCVRLIPRDVGRLAAGRPDAVYRPIEEASQGGRQNVFDQPVNSNVSFCFYRNSGY
jgi:hypothetical protein